jgi:hypothetical protein
MMILASSKRKKQSQDAQKISMTDRPAKKTGNINVEADAICFAMKSLGCTPVWQGSVSIAARVLKV